jgi:hypothetical protein
MFLFDLLGEIIARIFISWFIDREVESADTTPADLLVRFSVAAGVIVLGIWLFGRFSGARTTALDTAKRNKAAKDGTAIHPVGRLVCVRRSRCRGRA